MTENEASTWEEQIYRASYDFASKCAKLYSSNPYSETPLLRVMNTMMTELWDRGFSQSEIRTAFEAAVLDMPRCAAGEERRGDSGLR